MIQKLFKHYDYSLIVVALLLTGFGVVMVYSASVAVSLNANHPANYFFIKQLFWVFIAIIALLCGMILPYKMYKALVKPIIFITLFLLVLVLLVGTVANHAQSWFDIGPFSVQPAEIAKLSVIIYLASVFSNKQNQISDFKSSVLPPLIMISLVFLLIAIQPDLGSAMIIAGISGTMILCSGIRVKHILMLLGLACVALSIIFFTSLSDVQSGRFAGAYHPFDPKISQSTGLQLINSYIAIASGGFTGKGLGESIEKTGYLPEPQTDFIMSITAEELGLIGVLFVIICLAYLVTKSIYIGIRCQDVFGSLLAIGIGSFMAIQTFINLGVVTGLLPITGVTLPFISYGGSSLVMMMFSVGIVVNLSGFVKIKEQVNEEETAKWRTKTSIKY
ncbi:cell division protein FtsW [Pullulanibacillus pueri]|uniref:Probable peptidoglycan glycosyltransferase FtsW n=1 Tax=Pullulanibacillus pueri TaxID=1437324 RepID=A0A8J3EJA7_9BACL|nr:putative lipid II flippase FtsW [Pullulanibacillus pueri]MBM7680094.1 cell division protein FtsW [Pullulanibacillus pueri]GGH74339.1 putative lipid II flippase FtsW [Pullulanibacillus pueri]